MSIVPGFCSRAPSPPPKLGPHLPCWVFEPVFQQVSCALFVVGSSPVYRSSVCPCVSSIEVIAPDVENKRS